MSVHYLGMDLTFEAVNADEDTDESFDTLADAMRLAAANIRTVLHAAGCNTPNWPTLPACLSRGA